MKRRSCLAACLLSLACSVAAQSLPPAAPALLQRVRTYLEEARQQPRNVWRDMAPLNADGTVNGYVEIARGDSRKWEFRIGLNRREIDRIIPAALGGYPINYGFLPQTISYDGDPADVLVLGPPLGGGTIARGRIAGLMRMMDTGDLDSKVVISPLDRNGKPRYRLEETDRLRMERFFNNYKKHQGKSTQVPGWGGAAEGLEYLQTTARFFNAARQE